MTEKKNYPNSGIISQNKDKQNDRHADYKGEAEVDGVSYWISGWLKEGKRGKFLSLAFKPKDTQRRAGEESQVRHDEDDDMPF